MEYKEQKISFLNDVRLEVVKDRAELERILPRFRKKTVSVFKGYDLSEVDLSGVDFSTIVMEDVIFGYFDSKRRERRDIFNVNFQYCKMKRCCFAHCRLERCSFDNTTMTDVDFFFTESFFCRFKKAKITTIDFRYSVIDSCSLGRMHVECGDFYMAAFKGTTNFAHSEFELCSLSYATFENHCLTMECIRNLAQEDYEYYSKNLINREDWYKQNPCAQLSDLNESESKGDKRGSKGYIAQEAQMTYTVLSGLYSGKGFFRNSNLAYAKSKKNELRFYYHSVIDNMVNMRPWEVVKNICRMINPVVAYIFGYGFKVMNIAVLSLLLVVCFWFFLEYYDSSNEIPGLVRSICNTMSPYLDKLDQQLYLWAACENAIGVLLVGFAGFVVANKIRNNS